MPVELKFDSSMPEISTVKPLLTKIPLDAPPTFEAEGLKVGYRVRIIVDRRLRGDASAKRRIVVC